MLKKEIWKTKLLMQEGRRKQQAMGNRLREAEGDSQEVLLYPSVFLSELVERDRGFMIMLILDVDFPLLAATANPSSVCLFSVLTCVSNREHDSVETALPRFGPLTGAPRVPGLSN